MIVSAIFAVAWNIALASHCTRSDRIGSAYDLADSPVCEDDYVKLAL